jgi:hypothetical protein
LQLINIIIIIIKKEAIIHGQDGIRARDPITGAAADLTPLYVAKVNVCLGYC